MSPPHGNRGGSILLAALTALLLCAPIGRALAETGAIVGLARLADSDSAAIADGRGHIRARAYERAESLADAIAARANASSPVDSVLLLHAFDLKLRSRFLPRREIDESIFALAQLASDRAERVLGPDDPLWPRLLADRARLDHYMGRYDLAESLFVKMVAVLERQLGPEHPGVADALNELSSTRRRQGRLDEAAQDLKRALAIQEKREQPEDGVLASTLHNLANTYTDNGDIETARPLWERALELRQRFNGPDHEETATTLQAYAAFLTRAGEHDEAAKYAEQALAIQERILGPKHSNIAHTTGLLARIQEARGDFDAAQRYHQQALALRLELFGPDHPEVGTSRNDLGSLLLASGDYAGARREFTEALRIQEAAYGSEHTNVGMVMSNLGATCYEAGDIANARRWFERALSIQEKALGPDHPDIATFRLNVGVALMETGDLVHAEPLLEQAARDNERLLPPTHQLNAYSLGHLGRLRAHQGRFEEGIELMNRALSIMEAENPLHPKLPSFLSDLADAESESGDLATARQSHEKQLDIANRSLGPLNRFSLLALQRLALLDAERGDEKAMTSALASEALWRDYIRAAMGTASEREALLHAESVPSALGTALALLADDPDRRATTEVWDSVVRSRAFVLDQVTVRRLPVLSTEDPSITLLYEELTQRSREFAGLLVRDSGEGRLEEIAAARSSVEDVQRRLATASSSFRRSAARDTLGIRSIGSSLPDGHSLVAYARYERPAALLEGSGVADAGKPRVPVGSARSNTSPSGRAGTDEYVAFILSSRDARPRAIVLGDARSIDELVQVWRAEASRTIDGDEIACRAAGVKLRQAIWDPIASVIGSDSRVFLVPDGALHLINFAALPVGSDSFLVETRPFLHCLLTERDLVEDPDPYARGSGLLALGGADFDRLPDGTNPPADSTRTRGRVSVSQCDFSSVRFASLPGSSAEVEAISKLWTKTQKDMPTRLEGARATEDAVKSNAPGKRVLHLATHGFYLGDACSTSVSTSRGIGGLGRPQAAWSEPVVRGESPLRLSGLALAGANRRDKTPLDQEDGILTAEELATLDLRGVEWAVLSACDTGLGTVRAGQGVFGLRRSLQVAGTRTAIFGLWSIEDEDARRWMRHLYDARFADGLNTAEAVRAASVTTLKDLRAERSSTHPAHWAGFVAAGSWR